MPNLSKRLLTIASLVPFGARVCDIGTDHGYLSIYLAKENKCSSIIATDINKKPLSRAKINIEKENLDNIDLRLCNGLDRIKPNEADTFIIAGMGGEVISGIIQKGIEITAQKNILLVLQPTTSPEFLRKFLCKNGFFIEKEIPVLENDKLYSVMLVKYVGVVKEYPEYFYYTGILSCDTKEGYLYIKKQYDRCFKCAENLKKTEKISEFNYYQSVCDGISKYIKERKNGI